MKTIFVKETDAKGRTYIVEGLHEKGKFSVKRFICEVVRQETEAKTQELADMILQSLNSK